MLSLSLSLSLCDLFDYIPLNVIIFSIEKELYTTFSQINVLFKKKLEIEDTRILLISSGEGEDK